MQVRNFLIVTIMSALLLAGCSSQPEEPATPKTSSLDFQFQAEQHKDNRLVGRFWSPVTQDYISWSQVDRFLPDGGWLFIGESLGHPDNAQIVEYFIEHLGRSGRLAAVAIEALHSDQQAYLDDVLGQRQVSADDLQWSSVNGEWESAQDVVLSATRFASRVVAADLSVENKNKVRTSRREVAHYSRDHSDYVAEFIYNRFCQLFTREQARNMVDVHIARDQHAASQITANTISSAVNIFVGDSNRIRDDIGVPLWLAEDINVRTLKLVPVTASTNPEDYVGSTLNGLDPAQLFYFIPSDGNADSCAATISE